MSGIGRVTLRGAKVLGQRLSVPGRRWIDTQEVCNPMPNCSGEKHIDYPCFDIPPRCPRRATCDPEFYKLKPPKPPSKEFKCPKKIICEDEWDLVKPVKNRYLTDSSVSTRGPHYRDEDANNQFY